MDRQEKLIKILERMERLCLLKAQLAKSEPTIAQLAMLAELGRMPGCRANEVAKSMGLTAPTVSAALHRLEDGGLLERKPDPEDKRAHKIFLSQKGLAILREMRAHRNEKIRQFMQPLDNEEQLRLLALLEKASNHMENALQEKK
jgi:DNA-binding MarR family transcriptional regulator